MVTGTAYLDARASNSTWSVVPVQRCGYCKFMATLCVFAKPRDAQWVDLVVPIAV